MRGNVDWFTEKLLEDPRSIEHLYAIVTGKSTGGLEIPDWYLEACIADSEFMVRVMAALAEARVEYYEGYRQLEDLEEKEDFPATRWCCSVLDEIAVCIPPAKRIFGHVPVCGRDFYWARIFTRTCFEDIAFDVAESVNAWWEIACYNADGRTHVISTLIRVGVLSGSEDLTFVSRDSHLPHADDEKWNRHDATLVVAGGHNVLDFLKDRFGDLPLEYGAIITVNPFVPPDRNLALELKKRSFERCCYFEGGEYVLPYAIGYEDITVYLHK